MPADRRRVGGATFRALVRQEAGRPDEIQLFFAGDQGPPLPQRGQGPPDLWRYPATVRRYVDGDTLDAEIEIGFGIMMHHRLRLAGIQAHDARMQIVSSRHGKWRRWRERLSRSISIAKNGPPADWKTE